MPNCKEACIGSHFHLLSWQTAWKCHWMLSWQSSRIPPAGILRSIHELFIPVNSIFILFPLSQNESTWTTFLNLYIWAKFLSVERNNLLVVSLSHWHLSLTLKIRLFFCIFNAMSHSKHSSGIFLHESRLKSWMSSWQFHLLSTCKQLRDLWFLFLCIDNLRIETCVEMVENFKDSNTHFLTKLLVVLENVKDRYHDVFLYHLG